MKTDPIFYRLFQEFPNSFFELIGQPSSTANAYQFDSFELKQTAFRIDGLFLPKDKQSQQPLYFIEVQFQKDQNIYSNLFAEIFIYLNKNDSTQDWRAVVIYQKRNLEPQNLKPYQELLNSEKVIRVYLDELKQEQASLGVSIIQLVVGKETETVAKAKQLLVKATQELTNEQTRKNVLNLIETIVVYKFPSKSREELEEMLGLNDLKQTRFYQEAREEGRLEGKLEIIPTMLERGFNLEEIAEILKLDVEQVRQVAQK